MQIEKSFTQRQAELSATKQALLAQRLRQLRQPAALPASSDRIGPRPSAQILPLSFAQQRLWFLQQLEPESPAYNEAVATRFSGPLNRSAFTLSVREFLRRHEIMRCRFPLVEGRVQQVLDQEIHQHFVMPCEDLRSLPAHQR